MQSLVYFINHLMENELSSFLNEIATSTLTFRKMLNKEIARLSSLCETWMQYKENTVDLTADARDFIDVTVGQTKLLITKKFQQFLNLIVACEAGDGEDKHKSVTSEDLQGFWDMIYIQIENLNTRFDRLTDLKNQNWNETIPNTQTVTTKVKKAQPKKPIRCASATSTLRAQIEAARNKQANNLTSSSEDSVFDGGFFIVKSPVKVHLETPKKAVRLTKSEMSSPKIVGSPGEKMLKASAKARFVENYNIAISELNLG